MKSSTEILIVLLGFHKTRIRQEIKQNVYYINAEGEALLKGVIAETFLKLLSEAREKGPLASFVPEDKLMKLGSKVKKQIFPIPDILQFFLSKSFFLSFSIHTSIRERGP